MAKRPGGGGIILAAVILGIVTAYFVYSMVRDAQKRAEANWKPVVIAKADIPAKKTITRDMIDLTRMPADQIADNALTDLDKVEGKICLEHIRAKDQIRGDMVVKEGQGPNLSYVIPPGKRAIAIKVDDISGVGGGTIQPNDHVDILATFTDPVAKQEITQMILQNVPVLAVDRGRTDASTKEGGASASVTLSVSPEDAELLTAADRTGVLRVMLRPVQEENVVATGGIRAAEISRGRFSLTTAQPEETGATPVKIVSPQRERAAQEPLTIYRGTQATQVQSQ